MIDEFFTYLLVYIRNKKYRLIKKKKYNWVTLWGKEESQVIPVPDCEHKS